MKTSDQTTDLLIALCAARLEFPVITRNREGFSKRGGQKYQYADMNVIIDGVVPILAQHGLLLVQGIEDGQEGTLLITSTLFHAQSGQWVSSGFSVQKPDNMQDLGSVCTYSKRYAMQAMLSISTEDDDDAASLHGSQKAEQSAAAEHRHPSMPVSTNGHTPAPEPDEALGHPTEAHLGALRTLALETCHEAVDAFETRLRRTAGLPAQASLAPKLLSRTLTMSTFMEVYGWYVKLAEQLTKSKAKEAPGGTASASQPTPQPTAATTAQESPAVPPLTDATEVGPSSASAPALDPGDTVEALVADAISWGLKEDVTRRVITLHRDLTKCRRILAEAAERNRRQVA